MNIGSAVRSQEFDAVHIDVANTCPAGVAAYVSTAAKPHTANASAIQTPDPRIANKSSISARERLSTDIALTFLAQRDRVLGSSETGASAPCNDEQLVNQRDGQDQRTQRHRSLRVHQWHT